MPQSGRSLASARPAPLAPLQGRGGRFGRQENGRSAIRGCRCLSAGGGSSCDHERTIQIDPCKGKSPLIFLRPSNKPSATGRGKEKRKGKIVMPRVLMVLFSLLFIVLSVRARAGTARH